MPESQGASLKSAIRTLHGCGSTWLEAVPVKETFQGQTVWEGTVQVFELHGHRTATRCYAWSHETDEGKQRFVAVLHEGPVDSPEKAVRAAIAAQQREKVMSTSEIKEGDTVVVSETSPQPLYRGLKGTVVRIKEGAYDVDFPDGTYGVFRKNELEKV